MKNYLSVIITSIVFFLFISFLSINYFYSFEKTYEKNYYLVKEGDPSFIKFIKKDKNPVINLYSVKHFVKKSLITIFSYKNVDALENLDNNKNLFNENEFFDFRNVFEFLVEDEKENGVVIKETIVSSLYYMGKFKFSDNKFYLLGTLQYKLYGESGKQSIKTKRFKIIVSQVDFEKNKTGLAIESIILN